jgi:hypothetical protein
LKTLFPYTAFLNTPKEIPMRTSFVCRITPPFFAALALGFAPGAFAQEKPPSVVQVVALDECDPATFDSALGPDFCKNITLGAFTTLSDLFAGAASGSPDPGWDFEPDSAEIRDGAILSVVDQGGEPHTFTEVAKFGGGFIPVLNAPGQETVPECSGWIQEHRSGQDSNPPGQHDTGHEPVKRRTSFSVLHPSMDEVQGQGEVISSTPARNRCGPGASRFISRSKVWSREPRGPNTKGRN